jgi:hypothetical protein
MAATEKLVTIQAGDRLDILAWHYLGDPERYRELLVLNPALDIWSPQVGMQIRVPNAR